MEIIYTTATASERLKHLAKLLRKTTGMSLASALNTVAKQHGYEHWRHVTVCLEALRQAAKATPAAGRMSDAPPDDIESDVVDPEWIGGVVGFDPEVLSQTGGTISLFEAQNTMLAADGRVLRVTRDGNVLTELEPAGIKP